MLGEALGGATLCAIEVQDLVALREADGWLQVRMKGSHRQFHHPAKRGTVTIAGKLSVDAYRHPE